MLKLHHFDRSPFGFKVRLVLAEKNVPYALVVPEDKANDPKFGQLNPFRMTPVLELEDGRAIWESTVINEYLEEAYPTPAMLPKDPYERARVRMLEDSTDQYLYSAHRTMVQSQFDYQPPFLVRKASGSIDPSAVEESRKKVHEHLTRLEKELSGRRWFGGDVFSLADAALAPPITGSLVTVGLLPDPKYPELARWTAAVKERPSYRAAAPKEPMRIKES